MSLLQHVAGAAFVVLTASAVLAQDTPIRSVRVNVAPKTRGASVIVRNLRDSALMAWRLETPDGIHTWNWLGDLIRVPKAGPIQPHETRTVSLTSAASKRVAQARITAAVFADGYYEGELIPAGFFLKDRQEAAERFKFWLDAFDKMLEGTEQQKADYLMAKIVERAGASTRFDNVGDALRRRLPGRTVLLVSTIVEDIRPQVEAALRDTSRPPVRAPDGAPSSLTLKVVPSDRAEYVVQIENLRDNAAIEGWMLGFRRQPGGPVQPFQGNDACTSDPSNDSRPGPSGRILPHQARSIDISFARADATFQIDVAMVLFDDLSFEGSAEVRDRMLAQRARIAEDYGYWLAVYREAAALSLAQAKALFEARRSERAGQKAAAGAGPGGTLGTEALGALERSPQTFPGWLKRRTGELEGAYARLTRKQG